MFNQFNSTRSQDNISNDIISKCYDIKTPIFLLKIGQYKKISYEQKLKCTHKYVDTMKLQMHAPKDLLKELCIHFLVLRAK